MGLMVVFEEAAEGVEKKKLGDMVREMDGMVLALMGRVGAVMPPLLAVLLALCTLLALLVILLISMLRAAWRKKSPRNNEGEDWVDIKKRVVFVHPDLGVGGAERLVVDAAVELVNRGYVVNIYTAYHSEERCFPETIAGGFGVYVHGNFLPRHIFGKFHAICACMRTLYAALSAIVREGTNHADESVFIVDQVSFVVPILRAAGAPVAFYCHFPDLLLAQRTSLIRQIYRFPIDIIEELTTCCASIIMVNSEFTLSVFRRTFTFVADALHANPKVVYPAVSTATIAFSDAVAETSKTVLASLPDPATKFPTTAPLFVSLNRFERKKMVELAILALAEMKDNHEASADARAARLLVAGGYDSRLAENIEYLDELRKLAADHGVSDRVAFLPNFSLEEREKLLRMCAGVVYTPPNEHFGIVPLEAMASGRPVIACDSGGPRESIVHGTTGYLCQPTAHGFAEAMAKLADASTTRRSEMGKAARQRVEERFSRTQLGNSIEEIIKPLFL